MNEELIGKNEMGKLYSFGCSHTAGTPNINTTDDEFTKSQVKYWKSKTYPSYVAKEFGLENINCAIGGGSHKDVYRIFFTTLPKITTDDFFQCWNTNLGMDKWYMGIICHYYFNDDCVDNSLF